MARIIVIDDDATSLAVAGAMLRRLGHEVTTAASVEEGLTFFVADEIDLVLTDLFMPGQDGFEAMKRVRGLDPDAKVVCMSAGPVRLPDSITVRDAMFLVAREFGADACIAKPLDPGELKAVIDAVLAAPRGARAGGAGRG